VVTQALREPAGDLRDLERVSQSAMNGLSRAGGHHLGNPRESLERGGVKDSIAVSFPLCANANPPGTLTRRQFDVPPLFRPCCGHV
jgi:hypothetical protein